MTGKTEVVIAINPGSTSTKFGLWSRGECLAEKTIKHSDLPQGATLMDQFEHRRSLIEKEIDNSIAGVTLLAIAGRGGLLKPLAGGAYQINAAMLSELKAVNLTYHASNLGAFLADFYARKYEVNAYIVDPVTVDEFTDLARISGVPWIKRKSRAHALNIKAVVRRATAQLGLELANTRLVVAHLGGGTSIAAVKGGKLVDVNDALLGMGPFSPERAGALPIGPLIERCFSGEVTKQELLVELTKRGGIAGYCGTSDIRIVLELADRGDDIASLALDGMMYQNAKEIGAMATVLQGKVDAVIITGGIAFSESLMEKLKSYVGYIAPVLVFPGEDELKALAEGVFRVLDGDEEVKNYGGDI